MSHHRFRQLGITLILAAALGLAGAQPGAARVSGRGKPRLVLPQPGRFESAWDWLGRWVPGGLPEVPGLSRLWAADWGGLDPNGAKTTGTPPAPVPTTDMGPGIDPNGSH
jgi:hypothetical protein